MTVLNRSSLKNGCPLIHCGGLSSLLCVINHTHHPVRDPVPEDVGEEEGGEDERVPSEGDDGQPAVGDGVVERLQAVVEAGAGDDHADDAQDLEI